VPTCLTCHRELPAQPTGRPRKYHGGNCTAEARRARDGVCEPRRATCRLCSDPITDGRLYFCSAVHADRWDSLNREQRAWLRQGDHERYVVGDTSTASAGEILPGMSQPAVTWRLRRQERLERLALAA
jgi:hypothetical protein